MLHARRAIRRRLILGVPFRWRHRPGRPAAHSLPCKSRAIRRMSIANASSGRIAPATAALRERTARGCPSPAYRAIMPPMDR